MLIEQKKGVQQTHDLVSLHIYRQRLVRSKHVRIQIYTVFKIVGFYLRVNCKVKIKNAYVVEHY